ncbi:putative leucine-rich repeat-containing protein DDB_G0290503 [Halyomorpha halys]|uniref:putative leucine-rich repeat-containing protein DDB_G0290503 n=1 Tax=Halyomorpha halys TaxID=286706 RepID=UPI0006D4F182|nr:hyaluronan mediated motility receptor-like [Halyomorpha halys]
MSFPKARILRFNEEMTCAPPPGKYDPKFEKKVIGVTIDKSKRFNEKKAGMGGGSINGSTESLDSACSRCTSHSHNQVVFRTPQMPKKRVFATPRSAVETSQNRRTGTTTGLKTKKKLNDIFMQEKENLLEQTPDKEQAYCIFGKDQEISSLLNEISELKKSMLKMENSSDILLNNLRSEFETSFNRLSAELEQSKNELEKEREGHKKSLDDFKSHVSILEENIKNCNAINSNLEEQLAEKQISLEEMSNKHIQIEKELKEAKETIEKLLANHASEIKALKQRCSEEIEEITTAAELNLDLVTQRMENKIKEFQREVENNQVDETVDFVEKINEIGDVIKEKVKLFDSQILDILNKLKIIEEDLQKKSIEIIDSLKLSNEVHEDKLKEYVKVCESLETQKVTNLEQKILIVELQDKVDMLENEIGKLKKQCNKYEVIQNEASKTIHVLSQRLFESESEVEKQNEIRNEMKLRINALEEQIRNLIYENNQLNNNLSDLRGAIVAEVKEVEKILLGKVDNYKKKAAEETHKYRLLLEERQNQIDSLMKELEFYKNKAVETSECIMLCQSRLTSYKEEIKELSLKFNDLDDEYNEKMSAQKNLYSILNKDYKKLQEEFQYEKDRQQNEIESLYLKNSDLEKQMKEKIEEVKDLQTSLEETKLKLRKTEKELEETYDVVHEKEQVIEDLASKLDHYTDCAQKTTQQINSLKKINEDLEGDLKRMEEIINEKDLNIESLSVELSESKSYVQTVTEHFVTLMNELGEKDDKCESLTNELEMKNVNMIQVSEEYEKMKKLYESETNRATELEKDLRDTQRDNEKYVDELISELVLEKERCTELSQTVDEVKRKNAVLDKAIEDLENKLKETENIEVLKKKMRILEGNIEELKMENVDFSNEIEALYREIEDSEKEVEELKTEKKKMSNTLNELKGEKRDLMEMIKQQQEEMELLTNEISRQQEQIDELKQMKNDRIDELRAEFQTEVENEVLMLQQTLEEKQKIVNQLQAKEQDLVYKLKAAEADLIAAETEKKNSEDKLKDISEKNAELNNKLCAMEKRKNEYKLYAIDLEQDIKTLKDQLSVLQDDKEKLKEQYHEESMKTASVEATVADLECRNRELESIIGPFKDQLMKYESERADLLKKSATTEKELRALELAHAKALGHHNHKQKIKHVVHLTEQIAELKTELDKLRSENTMLRATVLEAQKEASLRNKRRDKENETSPLKVSKTKIVGRASSPALKERTNAH